MIKKNKAYTLKVDHDNGSRTEHKVYVQKVYGDWAAVSDLDDKNRLVNSGVSEFVNFTCKNNQFFALANS